MAAEKAPAFQFYAKDFLTDGHVAGMTLAERGAYITLLCLCWQERSLPTETARLARMVGERCRPFCGSGRRWKFASVNRTGDSYIHGSTKNVRNKRSDGRLIPRTASRARRGDGQRPCNGCRRMSRTDSDGMAKAMANRVRKEHSPIFVSDLRLRCDENQLVVATSTLRIIWT
jgi:hypothetical protein